MGSLQIVLKFRIQSSRMWKVIMTMGYMWMWTMMVILMRILEYQR
jgi:hypothetical protein